MNNNIKLTELKEKQAESFVNAMNSLLESCNPERIERMKKKYEKLYIQLDKLNETTNE